MNALWCALMLASLVLSLCTGTAAETAPALLQSGEKAVQLLLTMLATMTLWSGLMEILSETGDVKRLGRVFRRVGKPLFPGLHDEGCWDAISMNLSANLLGLGNAATPAGIDAAKRLSNQGTCGLQALAMLLCLDNAALTLLPTTVITLRQAAGARNPADVWGMTVLVSAVSSVATILMMRLTNRRRCS